MSDFVKYTRILTRAYKKKQMLSYEYVKTSTDERAHKYTLEKVYRTNSDMIVDLAAHSSASTQTFTEMK